MLFIAKRWIKYVQSNKINVINVTVCMAYSAMTFGDVTLKVSGVLAVVTLGIGLSKISKTLISKATMHYLHGFWEYGLFAAETIIFLTAGM